MTGITGSQILLDGSIEKSINNIRKITDKPIAVGFGISTAEQARAISGISDGVIVGSAIVRKVSEIRWGEQENLYEGLGDFLLKHKEAVR